MELSMGMFMAVMFIVGLVLTVYAFKLGPAVKNCSAAAQDAARGLVVLGVMLLSISGTYMVCGCEKIGSPLTHSVIGLGFVVLMLLIGISVIGLTSTIHKECKNARTDTPVLIAISSITTLVSIVYLVYRGYSTVSKKSVTTGSFRF